VTGFETRGWVLFDDPSLLPWIMNARQVATAIAADPGERRAWLRHGGTWFAGVNALPNDSAGALAGGPPLKGLATDFVAELLGAPPTWDRGQLSIVYPGYPCRDPGESDAAHRFRRKRDAAHVDGLLPVGPERRRQMREPHAFVLGIPLTPTWPGASPMVIWEGSHEIMREAFRSALSDVPMSHWQTHNLTDVYQAARRRCFELCARVPLVAQPGQSYLLHRLALHGVAPWDDKERIDAPSDGRMIVYFRPPFAGTNWLEDAA